MEVVNNLSLHSKSLLYNANNNAVEQFNSIIAKHIGGKRINFSLRVSYDAKCKLSAVSHNSKLKYNKIPKLLTESSPGFFCKKRENKIRGTKRSRNSNKTEWEN